jgi:hypothetical protein
VANECVYAEGFVSQIVLIDNDDSPFLLLSRSRTKREGETCKRRNEIFVVKNAACIFIPLRLLPNDEKGLKR